MDRALPGWAIDLIRDGVPTADLKAGSNRAVWSALLRTAMSAQVRGQDRIEWDYLLLDQASRLGQQLRLRDGHRPRSSANVEKTLSDAWEKAWERRTTGGPAWTPHAVAEKAHARAKAALNAVADPDLELTDRERLVLAYAAEQTRQRGLLRVALPWRSVQAATGLTERVTKTTLNILVERRMLNLAVPGRSGATKRRANLYALPDPEAPSPYKCRGTRPMGPSARPMGPLNSEGLGPHQTYGTSPVPSATEPDLETETAMTNATLTLTLTPAEQAAVLETLHRVRAAERAPATTQDADVISFRAHTTGDR